ncbi:epoxyqueuosine reductase QueH [Desulfothermobacter acidiphilus]|uniref:epoxyqueuosine reductase QueH n=1 Tax=Desulfothermobacter acidiphilus TaxID=1938353 RepID=UPI003F89A081
MKVLLHICCGPCAIYPLKLLRSENLEVHGFFFNPNIHPYAEYQRRREALEQFAAETRLSVIYDEEYPVEEFFRRVVYRESLRCRFCYHLRLERTAAVARRGRFDAFTTTLLVSPFQQHELISQTGEAVAAAYQIPFLYRDFRPGFKEGVELSRTMGLYRQQYCGCLYSEKERFHRCSKAKRG